MLSVDLFLWNNELTGGAVICIWNWVRKNADCTNDCSLLINTNHENLNPVQGSPGPTVQGNKKDLQ